MRKWSETDLLSGYLSWIIIMHMFNARISTIPCHQQLQQHPGLQEYPIKKLNTIETELTAIIHDSCPK